MFTGLYNLTPFPSIHDRLALFQGLRALFPVAAAYIALLWALASRAPFRFGLTTLGLLTYYGALGLASSIVLSPDTPTAIYWSSAFLAPLLVAWFVIERAEPEEKHPHLARARNQPETAFSYSLVRRPERSTERAW